jgi:4-oxalocrotonate tautomerase
VPLVEISLRNQMPEQQKRAIADGVHRALVDAIGIPEGDRFQIVSEHSAGDLIFDKHYMGVERRDVVFIRIIFVAGRSVEKKLDLYRRIAENLESAHVRPEDAFITLIENDKANWSVGNGVAQLLVAPAA